MNKQRSYKFDNFKAILIFLVVLGHLYENISFPTSQIQYLIIYSFHMPAFAFISGVFFKKNNKNKIVKTILLPYLIFQTIFLVLTAFYNSTFTIKDFTLQYTTPFWVLWYLLALFIWNLFANILTFTKKTGILFVFASFFIALLIGYETTIGYYLTLSRVICFFPYFLLGIYLKKYEKTFNITYKSNKVIKNITTILLLCSVMLMICFQNNIDKSWLYHSMNYTKNHSNFLIRLLFFLVALLFIIAFMIFIPDKKIMFFSNIGKNSMNVYLLHIIIIRFFPINSFLESLPYPIITIPLFALFCTTLLSTKPFTILITSVTKISNKKSTVSSN
ncbi:MAG: acyltransferase family protein [Lachnospiraceae bacterium]